MGVHIYIDHKNLHMEQSNPLKRCGGWFFKLSFKFAFYQAQTRHAKHSRCSMEGSPTSRVITP